MVSRLPVFSGKRLGTRVPREMVLPVFVVVVLFVALLLSYPWTVLTLGTLVYLGCLPLGFWSYRRFERSAAQAARHAANAANATLGAEDDAASARSSSAAADERPLRLN
jgi:CDP-diacylglycerol---serine O-phosphatidyltransferase